MENLKKVFNRLQENKNLSAEIEAAKEKFAFKPFALALRPLAVISNYSKFGLSAFSIITGFGCLYFGMVSALPEIVSVVLAVAILIMIEVVKGYALNIGFTQSYSNRTFSPIILLGFVFTGASVFLSLKGVASLYQAADETGQILQATQKKEIDSLSRYHNEAIQAAKKELETFKKSISWKGKIDMYNKGNASVISNLNERIKQAETDKRESLKAIQRIHTAQTLKQNQDAGFNITLWVFLSGFNEFGILLCLWFGVYYQYRIATDAQIINESASFTLSIPEVHRLLETALIHNSNTYNLTPINQPVIGFKLGQNKAPDKDNAHTHNVSSNVSTHNVSNTHNVSTPPENNVSTAPKNGICAQCGTPFKKRTGWHIYCSESCKILAWEKRTGKKYIPRKK
jgi:hypothetical protein